MKIHVKTINGQKYISLENLNKIVVGSSDDDADLSDKFEIFDLGWENPDYFSGFGVYGSNFNEAYYDVGSTPREAMDAVLEQVAGVADETLFAAIRKEAEKLLKESGSKADEGFDDEDEDEDEGDVSSMLYHIGIKFNP